MRITILSVCFSFIFIQCVVGQTNKNVIDKESFQTILRFDNPLSKLEAISQFKSENKLDKTTSYLPTYSNTDESGRTHQHLQQFYKGLKVEFGIIIIHSQNNEVYMINGEAYSTNGLNLTPTLNNDEALNIILNSKKGAKYLWDSKEDATALNYEKPKGELIILPLVKTGEIKLAYKFDIYTTEPLARDEIYVDAHKGAIIYRNPIIKHANDQIFKTTETIESVLLPTSVSGSANATKYSGVRPIKTTLQTSTNKYILLDDTRGGGIQTFNSARTTSYPTTNFTDIDNNWTTAEFNNTNKDIGALDAHWGAEMTYDFWKNIFNRNSYDDSGSALKSYVHYRKVATTNLVNAFWNGSVMSYGDGNTSVSILTALDVCGHEIGHGICSSTANLAYQNQSGALNEGLSDIWGACIEHYGRTDSLNGPFATGVWKIAEDLGTSPFRSMSTPNTYGNPDTYLGNYWTTTGDEGSCSPSAGNDQCGVHNNSGVLNHWYYILTVGKSGTNNAPIPQTYSVTGIGMAKSAQITYYAERDYLTPNATFLDMRNATLEVANSLYCGSSPEIIALTNAWYAVNVGNQYVGYATDIALKKVIQPMIVACGTSNNPILTIENSGTNAITSATISYSIDGGTTTNFNWTGNLAPCQTFDYPITIGTLTRGTHTITFTTTTYSDGNSSNNTKSSLLLVNDTGTVNTINTFETATDNLISIDKSNTNLLWQRGNATGTILGNLSAGNSKVYGTNLSGLYPNSTTSYLISQCYDLSQFQDPLIQFDMAYDLEPDYDFINVEYSTNSGNTWNILGDSVSTTTWYNSNNSPNGTNCESCVGAQWTGTNATKTQYMWSMSDFGYGGTNPQSNIIFRFNFNSDPGVQNEGVLIDNFVVTGSLVLSNQQNAFSIFTIYPNPSNGLISVQLSSSEDVKIELFDMRGRKCFSNTYTNSNLIFTQEIDFGQLQKGIYLLNISSEGKTSTQKIIIK